MDEQKLKFDINNLHDLLPDDEDPEIDPEYVRGFLNCFRMMKDKGFMYCTDEAEFLLDTLVD